jgi:cyclin-dependent kinase
MRLDSEDEGIPCTAIREIALLKELRHENIVRLLDVVQGDRKLTIVFEFCDMDLQKFMELAPLDAPTVKHLLQQLLRSIEYCHFRMVLHRDLKPQNLLISRDKHLKLADFGLGRAFCIPLKKLTHEVVTLWYRPPDVLLGSTAYGTAVDMWSVGCIFAEMATGQPLFAGKHDADQLLKIFSFLGSPNNQVWPSLNDYPNSSNMLGREEFYANFENHCHAEYLLKQDNDAREPSGFDKLGPAGIDLLRQMLQYEPSQRISATQALNHPYFTTPTPSAAPQPAAAPSAQ